MKKSSSTTFFSLNLFDTCKWWLFPCFWNHMHCCMHIVPYLYGSYSSIWPRIGGTKYLYDPPALLGETTKKFLDLVYNQWMWRVKWGLWTSRKAYLELLHILNLHDHILTLKCLHERKEWVTGLVCKFMFISSSHF